MHPKMLTGCLWFFFESTLFISCISQISVEQPNGQSESIVQRGLSGLAYTTRVKQSHNRHLYGGQAENSGAAQAKAMEMGLSCPCFMMKSWKIPGDQQVFSPI